ncbi:MAG TPA: methyltransferase [Mucilaginibacter sp.]|nr:methyltransferase [Mucilaginibacter sp.]
MNDQHQLPPPVQMMQMITGFWTSCCIYNAAKLNIADLLADGPKSVGRLAEITHSDTPSLYRVLRALASTGIFAENENCEFTNTMLSETLRDDTPGSMKAMALAQLGDHYNAWGNLMYSIKTGGISFDNVEGMPIWEYYESHPEEGVNFMKAMTGLSNASVMNVLPAYDFSAFKTIVDIGGGNGALLTGILGAVKDATGIVYDQEYVIAETKKVLAAKGYAVRCSAESGDFFKSVPAGADAYLMKMILHDWNDEQCTTILKNCNRAMNPGSKLLIIETVIPEGNVPHPGKFLDINMMAMTGGKERTEKEFAGLLSGAGLRLSGVTHTHSPMFSIVEAVKA